MLKIHTLVARCVALDNMDFPNDCYYICYVVTPLNAASGYRKMMKYDVLELDLCLCFDTWYESYNIGL